MNRECVRRQANAPAALAFLICLAACAMATSCAVRHAEEPRTTIENVPAPRAPAPAPALATVPESSAGSLDAYKQEVARRIYHSSAQYLFEGVPPPMLKSVVVLKVAVDSNGQPKRIAVLRSNGHRGLNRRAVQSVQGATPLPRPDRTLIRGGLTEFTETWLFRDDGRFQIRSLAQVQSSVDD